MCHDRNASLFCPAWLYFSESGSKQILIFSQVAGFEKSEEMVVWASNKILKVNPESYTMSLPHFKSSRCPYHSAQTIFGSDGKI